MMKRDERVSNLVFVTAALSKMNDDFESAT